MSTRLAQSHHTGHHLGPPALVPALEGLINFLSKCTNLCIGTLVKKKKKHHSLGDKSFLRYQDKEEGRKLNVQSAWHLRDNSRNLFPSFCKHRRSLDLDPLLHPLVFGKVPFARAGRTAGTELGPSTPWCLPLANLTAAHPSVSQRCSSAPRRRFGEGLWERRKRGTHCSVAVLAYFSRRRQPWEVQRLQTGRSLQFLARFGSAI